MMCVFAMDTTADGGFVIAGNNSNNGDDYTVTKFAPPYQPQIEDGATGGGYATFGGSAAPIVHYISGTETWSSSMNVASLVEVASGATLNITGSTTKISFAASDQLWDYFNEPVSGSGVVTGCGIIVLPGGTLNITQATLQGISIAPSSTTLGEHNVWDGIVVEGTPSSSTSSGQGHVTISGANIMDARCGVYVAENYRTYHKSPVAHTPDLLTYGWNYGSRYDGYTTLGGGILTANTYGGTPTTFTNCYYGANLENYVHPNASTFSGCTFTGDANGMGDICFYTNPAGKVIPPNTHIGIWGCGTVGIYNNIFTGNTGFPAGSRSMGIQTVGSYVNISNNGSVPGNTFTNLSYGVMASGIGTANISFNTFDNNANGINASSGGIVIQNNTIKVPTLLTTYNATGITLAGAKGYNVTNNTLTKCSTCGSLYGDLGIVVNDGHTQNEVVRSNIFNYVRSATMALQTNGLIGTTSVPGTTGLQFLCNTYNNSWAGISRYSTLTGYSTTVAGTINNNQGYCGTGSDPTTPAGNQFFMPCDYPTAKLDVNDATVSQVVTYNNNSEYSVYDPYACYNSTLYSDYSCLISGEAPLFTTACPVPPVIGPTGGCPGCPIVINPVGTSGTLSTLDAAMESTDDPATLAGMQAEHDELVNDLVLYYALDTSYDSAAALLTYYNRYSDALPYFIAAGDYTDAGAMYEHLPLGTNDDKLYAWEAGLMLNLYSNGKTWFDLDSASADSMMKITQYNSPAGYMAGAVTALLGIAPVTWPVPVLDTAMIDSVMAALDTSRSGERTTHGGALGNGRSPITTVNKTGVQSFSVYPNPTFGSIMINTTMSGRFTLFTMLGQQLAEYTVTSGSTNMQLPTGISPGIYIGKFKSDNGRITQEVRLVYQP